MHWGLAPASCCFCETVLGCLSLFHSDAGLTQSPVSVPAQCSSSLPKGGDQGIRAGNQGRCTPCPMGGVGRTVLSWPALPHAHWLFGHLSRPSTETAVPLGLPVFPQSGGWRGRALTLLPMPGQQEEEPG